MKIPSFLILFFVTVSVFSQNYLGIRAGIVISKHEYYSSGVKSDNVVGIEVGALDRWHVIKGMYLQPEITFLQKGGSRDFLTGNLTIKTNQIEGAALLGYEQEFKHFSLFLNPGAFYGRVLSKTTEGNPIHNLPYNKNFDENWDYGLLFGGGVGFLLGKGKLILEGRYRHSLNKFRTIASGNSQNNIAFTTSLKNRTLGVNLNYCILIGKKQSKP